MALFGQDRLDEACAAGGNALVINPDLSLSALRGMLASVEPTSMDQMITVFESIGLPAY
jgi:hypothetical protein